MKTKTIFNKIIKNIKTLFYYIVSGKPCKKKNENDTVETGFSGKLSEKLSNRWRKRKQRINYNFNMKDFFTLEGKIEENRRFLRETQEKYEKIREYYPLFFIYIGMLGVYSFDILTYILTTTFTGSVFFLSSLFLIHIILFIYVFYLFTKILILKSVMTEIPPKKIYNDYVEKSKAKNEKEIKDLRDNELEGYLLGLEEASEHNYKILREKKLDLSKVVRYSIYSFIIYILLITFYKINSMEDKNKQVVPPANKIEVTPPVKKNLDFIMDSTIKIGDVLKDTTKQQTVKENVGDRIKK